MLYEQADDGYTGLALKNERSGCYRLGRINILTANKSLPVLSSTLGSLHTLFNLFLTKKSMK